MRRAALILCSAVCFGLLAQPAFAAGGTYTFASGTPQEQATVRAALQVSTFNWGLIPATIAIHIAPYGDSYSTYGQIYLDSALLDTGKFSWGVVQHEMGHQVDFFLLDDAKRQILQQRLGGKDWCYTVPGLQHSDHACERFASELAWAYWQSPDNSMRPTSATDEAAGMPVADFRTLLAQLLGAPTVAVAPVQTKAFAPTRARPRKRP